MNVYFFTRDKMHTRQGDNIGERMGLEGYYSSADRAAQGMQILFNETPPPTKKKKNYM